MIGPMIRDVLSYAYEYIEVSQVSSTSPKSIVRYSFENDMSRLYTTT